MGVHAVVNSLLMKLMISIIFRISKGLDDDFLVE